MLARILVFANLFFSLTVLGWATMHYTNRVDFTKATKGEVKGEMAKRETRLKELSDSLVIAQTRSTKAKEALLGRERLRPENQAWYKSLLDAAQFGVKGNKAAPLAAVASKEGMPLRDPRNPERLLLQAAMERQAQQGAQGRPLLSLAYYLDSLAAVQKDIRREQERLRVAVEEDTKLSLEVVGDKGLRQRIADEQVKKSLIEAELVELKPREINASVGQESLVERRDQMRARVAELKKTAARE